jgi:hypothetical protein
MLGILDRLGLYLRATSTCNDTNELFELCMELYSHFTSVMAYRDSRQARSLPNNM